MPNPKKVVKQPKNSLSEPILEPQSPTIEVPPVPVTPEVEPLTEEQEPLWISANFGDGRIFKIAYAQMKHAYKRSSDYKPITKWQQVVNWASYNIPWREIMNYAFQVHRQRHIVEAEEWRVCPKTVYDENL
jgi:hypothetical protein